ncbi:peptidyl-tRNA hydrolase [Candidatus Nomurabacteria bacterium]|nr:peptidyl-tRNA hydrolase [Candidatus Nomurabacteria bacterium]
MKWTIVGLGNPTDEYEGTRHNVGKELLAALEDKLPSGAKVVELDVYMNRSGPAIKKAVGSAKNLIVIHDELDIPLGKIKISYGNSGGGHNGVKSVIAALKSQDFVRIRVGISPSTPSGKLKRPTGDALADFVLGKFRPPEKEKLKKVKKLVQEAIELIVEESFERAQSEMNSR